MDEYNHKHSLVWQKWVDPFGGDDLDTINIPPPSDIGDFDDDMGMSDLDESDIDHIDQPIHKTAKVIMTPLGLIPYNENTASSKIFNFWTGHTNFNLSAPIVGIIQASDGVEALDVFTRYRFRIAIGQLFDPAMVMSTITSNVYSYLQKEK
jgi:hypothetical protein